MVWFCDSRHAEMVWFWWLERRVVWFWWLERRKRLRDFIFIKMVWFGWLERRWYDLGDSRHTGSWWPDSRDVIIPWAGYPNQTCSLNFDGTREVVLCVGNRRNDTPVPDKRLMMWRDLVKLIIFLRFPTHSTTSLEYQNHTIFTSLE